MKVLFATLACCVAVPAAAQMHDMSGMHMPGMTMPAAKPQPKKAARKKPAPKTVPTKKIERAKPTTARPATSMPSMDMGMGMGDMHHAATPTGTQTSCSPEHAAMGHCSSMAGADAAPAGTDQVAGNAPAPAPPATRYADRFYAPAAMATADRMMRAEHGGMRFSRILFNLAEVQARHGRDGYRWDGEGWFGGDIDRFVVKTQGEGGFGDPVETAEVQALYARAIDPYWNLQAGVRQDLGAGADRTYAMLGVEGLAPYWFDVEGAVFLSDKGDVLARAEAWYDQRITQRLVVQPRLEVNFAAQDMPASRIGSGLSDAEVGLRLRYEIRREFAPYVGVSWERRYGDTARYARANGGDSGGFALALGTRVWF